jgi:hypothetical protein
LAALKSKQWPAAAVNGKLAAGRLSYLEIAEAKTKRKERHRTFQRGPPP